MKNIYFILAILVLLTQGCNDFLEPKSQDKVVPKTKKTTPNICPS